MEQQQQCRKEKEGQIFTVWWQPTCLVRACLPVLSCQREEGDDDVVVFLPVPLGDESECAVRVKIRV